MTTRSRLILIAEDQETLRTSISRNLRARGFDYQTEMLLKAGRAGLKLRELVIIPQLAYGRVA